MGFSVSLKLHTVVISTQYGEPLKAARSRKRLWYSVPGEDGYPHTERAASYVAPVASWSTGTGRVLCFTAPVVEYIVPASALSRHRPSELLHEKAVVFSSSAPAPPSAFFAVLHWRYFSH